jgi:hypothetical protein
MKSAAGPRFFNARRKIDAALQCSLYAAFKKNHA